MISRCYGIEIKPECVKPESIVLEHKQNKSRADCILKVLGKLWKNTRMYTSFGADLIFAKFPGHHRSASTLINVKSVTKRTKTDTTL
jgi:hypothetical protein